jgi:hypothetical protein
MCFDCWIKSLSWKQFFFIYSCKLHYFFLDELVILSCLCCVLTVFIVTRTQFKKKEWR